MYKKRLADNSQIKLLLIITLAAAAIFFSKEVSGGIYKGIYFCVEVLIPSLFPFMVISTLSAKSGIRFKGKKFNKTANILFGLSGETLFSVILGIFGGYPVGARSIGALYKQGKISISEAEKASYIALGAGPGFLITFVGVKLLNNIEIGIILLISQICSVFLLGILNKFIFLKKDNNSYKENNRAVKHSGNLFIESVTDAVYSAMEMCAIVCVFSAFLSVIEKYIQSDYVSVFMEVTTACNKLSSGVNIPAIAFAVGFGGVCVRFQVFQALGNIKINKLLYFFYRILQGVITALITTALIKIFDITIPVFSSVKGNLTLGLSTSVIGSCLLVLTGICFIFSIQEE
jgi:hypothetical protein